MSTDHGFVIYHHWSVLSCKNTIRLLLVLSSALPWVFIIDQSVKVQRKKQTDYGCQPVSVQQLRTSEKTVGEELSAFVSSVSSGFGIWEFHTFAFGGRFVLFCCSLCATPCHAGHTRPHRPLSFLHSPLLSCRFPPWLCRPCTLLTRISLPAKTDSSTWTAERASNESHMRLILILLAEWDCLEVDVLLGQPTYPLPAPHIRLIISRAA